MISVINEGSSIDPRGDISTKLNKSRLFRFSFARRNYSARFSSGIISPVANGNSLRIMKSFVILLPVICIPSIRNSRLHPVNESSEKHKERKKIRKKVGFISRQNYEKNPYTFQLTWKQRTGKSRLGQFPGILFAGNFHRFANVFCKKQGI